jgi:hypothetical protein
MPWESLRTRIDSMPLVLAGPILRKVTPNSVTVWLALRQRAAVTLEIRTSHALADVELLTATAPTTQIGPRLHLLAITARTAVPLATGVTYFYNLSFATDTESMSLEVASGLDVASDLSYPPYLLPTFSLCPDNLEDLRLFTAHVAPCLRFVRY